ncbi:hypothetical protein Y032_0053g2392 [Ancylostoma ceylanicum]|uniref:Metalloendopeptidase n=1 Tax=Ancylostoma ceylanicum TaxID=53326 RepID=A0A016U707_9BILA|nr:hypothetical protein Y032_0053g2392 [Ancylostoma ceylanicum]
MSLPKNATPRSRPLSTAIWSSPYTLGKTLYKVPQQSHFVFTAYLYLFALTSVEPDPNGTPYDYYSITHAPKDYVAKPGTITIETLDKQYQNAWNISMEHLPNIEINLMFEDVIGNQKKPSKWDWKKICLMYKCDTCMGEKMEH